MERRGGRDSGKSVNGAMFGVVAADHARRANSEHSSRTGRLNFALTTVFTARRPQGAPVRGMGPLKTAKIARKGVKIDNGRVSRWEDPFFRIPHVLNGLEPPIRPPSGVGAVAVEGGENGPLSLKVS